MERLAGRGAKAVFAGCGMFGRYQGAVAETSPVPLATSSLLQVPLVLRLLPSSRRVLVVGVDTHWIGAEHLTACGATEEDLARIVVRGMEGAVHFRGNLLATIDELDIEIAERETLDVVAAALAEHDDIGAIVLECTNLGPYAAAVRRETGLPVWDPITLASWLHGGVAQP